MNTNVAMEENMKKGIKGIVSMLLIGLTSLALTGCINKDNEYGLDPKNPIEIVVWHYYNGAQAVAFEEAVDEFNNTVGLQKGIIVSEQSKSSINDLSAALQDSANHEVGAEKMPNIFQSYLDTAVLLEQQDILVDLDKYVTKEETDEYIDSYIQEGRFGKDNELKLFPIAKSTEIMAVNKTEFDKFASYTGITIEDLSTWESLTYAAARYYEWSGGKSFFGRDAFANYMIIGSKQLGKEIFKVDGDKVELQIDDEIMRKLWDNFYVPYVKGYFKHVGRYRSDDVKIGEIISCVCSTSGMTYFPQELTDGNSDPYKIETYVLNVPNFESTSPCVVQQGASMAVTKSDEASEYASVVFLKWFTQSDINIGFSVNSGYLPVKKEANNFDVIDSYLKESNAEISNIQLETLKVAVSEIDNSELYTTKGFINGDEARKLLESSMLDRALNDREKVLDEINSGISYEAATGKYVNDKNFNDWLTELKKELENICQ